MQLIPWILRLKGGPHDIHIYRPDAHAQGSGKNDPRILRHSLPLGREWHLPQPCQIHSPLRPLEAERSPELAQSECAGGSMTDQKPTGVFVRLPLSDEQLGKLLAPTGPLNERLLAIGMPVQGGELQEVDIVKAAYEYPRSKYVRQSEAQAQIAARDAEIVRLREIPELFSEYEKLMDSSEDVAGMVVYAELRKRVYESLKSGAE